MLYVSSRPTFSTIFFNVWSVNIKIACLFVSFSLICLPMLFSFLTFLLPRSPLHNLIIILSLCHLFLFNLSFWLSVCFCVLFCFCLSVCLVSSYASLLRWLYLYKTFYIFTYFSSSTVFVRLPIHIHWNNLFSWNNLLCRFNHVV